MNAPQEPLSSRPTGAEDVLARTTAAALAVSSVEGPGLFADLAQRLAEILKVDATLIAVFSDRSRTRLHTLAAWLDGRALRNFEYELATTPCRAVVGRESRFVGSGVHHEFGPDTMFAVKGFDSYAAHSMMSGSGEQLGMVVALDRGAMVEQQLTEALLKIFAARAAAEVERSRAEQSYRAIFDAAEDVVFVHDWDTAAILDVSAKAVDMYGYRPHEMHQMSVPALSANTPPYTAADALAHIERARRADAPHCFEWLARHRSGRLFWTEVTLKRAEIGGHRRVLAFVRDITDRKTAEQALLLREQQYRAIFDGSADAMVLWDESLRIVDVNRAFNAMYGFVPDEVIGTRFGELVPTVDVAPRLERLHRALQGEEQQLEIAANHKDGSRFDVELRYLPIQHMGAPHVLAIARDITQRRAAESALRDSEAQYRGIFAASADALVLWNSEHKIVDVNPAYERIYKLRREDVVGGRYPVDLPPAYVAGRLELVRRALAGEVCEVHGEAYRGDGSRFEVELRVLPIQHRGQPHALAIARDITERKRAEDALRASESQYRAIFDVSADALMLWDSQLKRVDVNPAHQTIFGYHRDEVVGRGFEGLDYPAAMAQERLERVRRALAGEASHAEVEAQRKGGERIVTELRTIPFMHRGEPHVLQIARDITEQKRAEVALRVSEARYRLLFETESDALVLVDVETLRLVDVNQAAASLYGRSRDELLRITAADLSAQPEETLRSIKYGDGPLDIPVRLHRDSSGRTFPVEIKANRLVLDGRMTVVAAIRDISERQRLESQLRQAQKMEAIGQLAGGIAHDFNNILTSILGYVVLAQERVADAGDARSEAHLEQAMAGCRRARDLVQQLLTFARGQRAQPTAVDLCALVRDAVPLLRASIPSTIELQHDCGIGLPPARADRVQIDQVLLNLVLNARDALAAAGRGRIGIDLALQEVHTVCSSCRQRVDGRFVELAVSDDGPGMDAPLAERVFEPFFSTKPPGPNSGMGLAMVHGIVHDHGGHVLLQTTLGAGASFRVLLPLASGQTRSVRQGSLEGPARRQRRRLQGRVLVVDDEPSVRDFLAELLRGWGLEVELAADGEAGLERIAAERFDLVLSDQTMPGLDGLSLAHALTTLPDPPPLLLMSGLASVLQAPLEAAGVQALLAKPLEPAALFDELQKHLRTVR